MAQYPRLVDYYKNNFDVPLEGRDDAIISCPDTFVVQEPFYTPQNVSEVIRTENVVKKSGGLRGTDYLVTMHMEKTSDGSVSFPWIGLVVRGGFFSPTDDFTFKEDGSIDKLVIDEE